MIYEYLNNSSANSTETTDSNGVTIYTLDLSTAGTSQAWGINGKDKVTYQIETSSVAGSGTLTLQYSVDDINWDTEVDDAGTDITWTISSDSTFKYADLVLTGSSQRFSWDGNNSAGDLKIKVLNG